MGSFDVVWPICAVCHKEEADLSTLCKAHYKCVDDTRTQLTTAETAATEYAKQAAELQEEVERLRSEKEEITDSRDSWRRVCEKLEGPRCQHNVPVDYFCKVCHCVQPKPKKGE